jgi:hypothetical protein
MGSVDPPRTIIIWGSSPGIIINGGSNSPKIIKEGPEGVNHYKINIVDSTPENIINGGWTPQKTINRGTSLKNI